VKSLLTVREAQKSDIPAIHKLLAIYAKDQIVLPRSEDDILNYLENFVVAEIDNEIKGCCAVRDFGNDLLEVRSLAVAPGLKGKGIGRAMVEAIIAGLQLKRQKLRLFALTYQAGFFERLGFHKVEKEMFPQKIWSDCVNCPKKDCCDEEAVMYDY
jgi:amino-acid N-acetyltransferase